jgi:DNA-directed RNA polymerase subunit N (RpoN/RPB10)
MVFGDVGVLDCSSRVLLSHVDVIEVTVEWCLATSAF